MLLLHRSGLLLVWAFCLLGFTGCFKKDEPFAPPPLAEGFIENVASLGKDYGKQAWFDLETNTFVRIADRGIWDLALDCRPQRYSIRLNSSKKMRLANTGVADWSQVQIDPTSPQVVWRYDESTGADDSTAFGPLVEGGLFPSPVFLVDLGLSSQGEALGYSYFQLWKWDPVSYTVICAPTPSGPYDTLVVPRNSDYNFVHLKLGEVPYLVLAEPPRATWDLVFTQYTTRVYYEGSATQFEWYSVNGVLINSSGTMAARDTVHAFESIHYETALNAVYTSLWDVIGYDWKSYNNNLGAYTIRENFVFIIRTQENHYFRLRFISFTNNQGERGYPTFRFSKI